MKKLLFGFLLCVNVVCMAQNENNDNPYKYIIVSYTESIDNQDFTVNIDDGTKIDYFKNEEGKKVHFRTPAAALTYFESLGWSLCSVGTSPKDNAFAHNYLTFWIFKKPITKEEREKIINYAIMK